MAKRKSKQRPHKRQTPYQERMARAKARGLTPSQARGHPRPGEKRLAPTKKRWEAEQLEAALTGLRRGETLRAAAKAGGISEERFRRAIREQSLAHREGRRWVLDEPPKEFPFYSNGAIVKPILSAGETSRAASYMNGAAQFLDAGEEKYIRPFAEGASSTSTASAIPSKRARSRSTNSTAMVNWTFPPFTDDWDDDVIVDPARRRLKRAGLKRQAQKRLGSDSAGCKTCPECSPHVLQRDHIAGRTHHDATAFLCRNCHDKRSAIQREEPPLHGDPYNPLQVVGRWLCGISGYAEIMTDFLHAAGDWLVRLAEHLERYAETVAQIGHQLSQLAVNLSDVRDWLWNAGVFLIRIAEDCADAIEDVPPPSELAAASRTI